MTLVEAVEKAREYLKVKDLYLNKKCRDFGDCWAFDWQWKDCAMRTDPTIIKVMKSTGELYEEDLGLPFDENFKRYTSAAEIDITAYLTAKEIEINKKEPELIFPSDVKVIEA